MSSSILFVTTHNLATNPRLVKEIKSALGNNFSVTVLCFEFDNWSKEINNRILSTLNNKINYIALCGDRTEFWGWMKSTIVQKISELFSSIFPKNHKMVSFGINKRTWLLHQKLKDLNIKPDRIIAHNPGSFYPAYIFSKRTGACLGIDLEDYHPGESDNEKEIRSMIQLQNSVLPHSDYVTAAAPLILEYAKKDAGCSFKNEQVILNFFSKSEFVSPFKKSVTDPVKLVWFSQHITAKRGLEPFLEVMADFHNVELHLYGQLNADFYKSNIQHLKNVFVHAVLPQGDLFRSLAQYDAGLALETVNAGVNRDICITNKILAYFQSGLYILATNTKGQKYFIEQHPNQGTILENNSESIKQSLHRVVADIQIIRQNANMRYQAAQAHNWETASQSLIQQWHQKC